MKHWSKQNPKKISLEFEDERIVSIKKLEGDNFRIREECDQYFSGNYSKKEIISLLTEAIEWIKTQP